MAELVMEVMMAEVMMAEVLSKVGEMVLEVKEVEVEEGNGEWKWRG
jgi:hypothetical protein